MQLLLLESAIVTSNTNQFFRWQHKTPYLKALHNFITRAVNQQTQAFKCENYDTVTHGGNEPTQIAHVPQEEVCKTAEFFISIDLW